jgi:hypothetical protein
VMSRLINADAFALFGTPLLQFPAVPQLKVPPPVGLNVVIVCAITGVALVQRPSAIRRYGVIRRPALHALWEGDERFIKRWWS